MGGFRRLKSVFMSLKGRLALVVAVSFAPAIVAIVHDHISRENRELADASRQAEMSVHWAAESYEDRFESARHVLIALSEVEPIRVGDRTGCSQALATFLPKYPKFLNLSVALKDGTLFASANAFKAPLDVSDRSHFKRVMESRDFAVGDLTVSRVSGKPTLICGYPIFDHRGELTRILLVSLDLHFLSPPSNTPRSFAGESLTLIDGQGNVLASTRSGGAEALGVAVDQIPFPENVEKFHTRERLYAVASVYPRLSSGLRVIVDCELTDLYSPARGRFYRNLGWLCFSLLVAAALCGRVGGYFITRHVERLLETTTRLTAGDLTARTGAANDTGELADLARAVDAMAQALQQRNAELEESRSTLEKQVELRTRELAESNRQLEAFGFSISHDLRAPLRAIDGFSQILLNEHASSLLPEGRRVLELVVKNTKQMAQLIDDLLAFSRLGRQDVAGVELNMGEMAREVFQDLATPGRARAIDFTVTPMPNAHGDSAMVRQVWMNLLENALKYTSRTDRAEVLVGAEKGEKENMYFVKDNGVGFDPRFAGKLFQVFQRLHGSSQFTGTGVGLAIVHRIIQKHGGRVWAESSPGKGAQFFFTLPAVTPRSRP